MNGTKRTATGRTPVRGLWAWAVYDWANSAFAAVIQTFVFAAYFARRVAADPGQGGARWGLTVGAAGFVIALLGPVTGAVADRKGRRKPWLGAFTLLAVTATALLWFIPPRAAALPAAMLLVWLGIIGTELAAVFYNAMLPALAEPERTGRWSGWGWALGYAGGLACLTVALFAFVREDAWFDLDRGAAHHIRATFPLVAAWYALFALPLFVLTPDAPARGITAARAVRDGLRQLADTLRHLRRYGSVVRFLVARMLYVDGLATIFAFGGVYAAGTFGLADENILLFGITLNITAGVGALLFSWLDDLLG
ncbi:MAG: MFS transporter, partial [Lentisphaerae bacterium]|nr:MFS transporter [Lentisphaerota bacterium]